MRTRWVPTLVAGLAAVLAVHAQDQSRALKVDVDLVQVYATVTDQAGRYVVGLQPEHFQVWEDKVEQQVETFSTEDVPLSVGILLDVSSSMRESLPIAKDAALTFLKGGTPEDEYFLVEFSDKAQVTEDFTTDITRLQNHIAFLPAKGRTALFDGLYLGLSKVREGANPRKFLLAITDGVDNRSRYKFNQVLEVAREQNVQIYGIRVSGGGRGGGRTQGGSITDIIESTGGRSFRAGSVSDLPDICAKIALEVKNQYIIGYRSTNQSRDGKYRQIRVKVDPPRGMFLFVRAREGYYGPTF